MIVLTKKPVSLSVYCVINSGFPQKNFAIWQNYPGIFYFIQTLRSVTIQLVSGRLGFKTV